MQAVLPACVTIRASLTASDLLQCTLHVDNPKHVLMNLGKTMDTTGAKREYEREGTFGISSALPLLIDVSL